MSSSAGLNSADNINIHLLKHHSLINTNIWHNKPASLASVIYRRRKWSSVLSPGTKLELQPPSVLLENKSSSERLVDPRRAALGGSGAPGDHAVPHGGPNRGVCADPLHDAGQTLQTGNQTLFAAGTCEDRGDMDSWSTVFLTGNSGFLILN